MSAYNALSKKEQLVVDKYFEELLAKLKLSLAPEKYEKLNHKTLMEYCLKSYHNVEVGIYHNVKDDTMTETMAGLLYAVKLKKKDRPIITAFNTLFHNNNVVENVPAKFLRYLLGERKVIKKEMFTHINDEDQSVYDYLDLLQTAFKILANSYYGAFGASSFCLYNKDLGPSVTYQGQMIIQTAILGFEGLIGANYFFDSFSEIIVYLENIIKRELHDEDMILDVKVSTKAIVNQIIEHCDFQINKKQIDHITNIVNKQPTTIKQKLYFKNNLFKLLEVDGILEFISENLVTDVFPDVNHPPKDIEEDLKWFTSLVDYFVFYSWPWPDKSKKADRMIRTSVLLSDTDSTFLNARPFLDVVCDYLDWTVKDISKEYRTSIVSIFTYVITEFIQHAFDKLTANANVLEEDRPLTAMKSELTVAHYKLF